MHDRLRALTQPGSPFSWGAGSSKVPASDAGPIHTRGPGRPQSGGERRAVGEAGRPLARFQHSPCNVCFAVAVEITHLHVDPSDGGGPNRPQASVEPRAGRYTGPPGAALQIASGDVGLAVAVEVADFDIDPG